MATATIPSKDNISRESGTIILTLSRKQPLRKKENLLKIGDFTLSMTPQLLTLEGKNEKMEVPSLTFYGSKTVEEYEAMVNSGEIAPGEGYPINGQYKYDDKKIIQHIVWTWIGDNHRLLTYNKETQVVAENIDEERTISGDFDLIHLASEPYWSGNYQGIQIYSLDYLFNEANWFTLEEFIIDAPILFHADYTSPMHYMKEPIVETTMVPKDQSPILVENSKGPMTRQYFFNHETGFYEKSNTERFLYRNEDALHVSYEELEPKYLVNVKFADGETFVAQHVDSKDYIPRSTNHFYVNGNTIHLDLTDEQKHKFYGTEVSVTYQLRNSYNVEYNEDTAHDSLKIHLVNHNDDEVSVIQEGNRFSNQRLAKEVELNPLVNSQHTGFLYIDKQEQKTQAFRLNTSSSYLTADGMDTADFIIEAIDEEGNEVLNPSIDVYVLGENGRVETGLGEVYPIVNKDTMKARRTSGRCYYKYRAPFIRQSDNPLTQRIFLVAYDRDARLGAQIPIYVRPFFSEEGYRLPPETLAEAPLPFKVMSQSYRLPLETLAEETLAEESLPFEVEPEMYRLPLETLAEASLPFEVASEYFGYELEEGHYSNLLDFNNNGVIDQEDFDTLQREKNNKSFMTTLEAALRIQIGYEDNQVSLNSKPILLTGLTQNYIIG